jgi:hypothetical protein
MTCDTNYFLTVKHNITLLVEKKHWIVRTQYIQSLSRRKFEFESTFILSSKIILKFKKLNTAENPVEIPFQYLFFKHRMKIVRHQNYWNNVLLFKRLWMGAFSTWHRSLQQRLNYLVVGCVHWRTFVFEVAPWLFYKYMTEKSTLL